MNPGRRSFRSRWGFAALVGAGAIALTACFAPAPAPQRQSPTTTAPPTTAPPAAHLSASPSTVNFNVEVTQFPPIDHRTITITNTGNAPSGALGVPDLTGLDEPGGLPGDNFNVSNLTCFSVTLAPGASCQFDLGFAAFSHKNSGPWTGDLLMTAAPGGTAHVSVTAQYTSKLLYTAPPILNATPSADASTHFQITNDSTEDFGPLSFTFNVIGSMGPIAGTIQQSDDNGVAVPPCTQGMTLLAGDSCQWFVTYSNATGIGTNSASLSFSFPNGIQGGALFFGMGNP